MIVSEITVKHQGRPPRRVMLVRVDNRRRARLARRMRAMGFGLWSIRRATRFSERALAATLAARAEAAGLWGDMAGLLTREMARVA